MHAHADPATPPITTDGAVVDLDPPAPRDDWDDLEDYVSSPATTVPTTYEALGIRDLLDFRSHFDAGDLSNGSTISTRIPDDMNRMLDILCHREDNPFRTKSDMAREGLFVLIKALVDKLRIHDPMLLSLMAEAKVRATTKFAVDRHEILNETRENLEVQLLFWLDRGEPLECGRAIQEYWDTAQKIVHAAWRNHVCAVLRGHPLVKAAALAAIAGGFLFSADLRSFTGDWK